MEHKGIQYQVVQTANPTGWKWTVQLNQGRTKTGVSFPKNSAIFDAVNVINKALSGLKQGKAASVGGLFHIRSSPRGCRLLAHRVS